MRITEKDRSLLSGIRRENDGLRTRIREEYGGFFVETDNPKISPELENEFLNYVLEFEKQSRTAEILPLYNFIGRPAFEKESLLEEKEISRALKRILMQMEEYDILFTTIGKYPDRQIYKFITEELFREKIENIRLPGTKQQFIYEMFYPNPELIVRQRVRWFLFKLFRDPFVRKMINDLSQIKGSHDFSPPIYFPQILAEKFDIFNFLDINFLEVTITGETARVMTDLVIDAQNSAKGTGDILNGPAFFNLKNSNNSWKVVAFDIPFLRNFSK